MSHSTVLNGTDQYWEITNANQTGLNPSSAITIEAWVKLDKITDSQEIVNRSNEGGGSSYDGYRFSIEGNRIAFLVASGSNEWTENKIEAPSPLEVGVWYHVAVSYDASSNEFQFYINGSNRWGSGAQSATGSSAFTGSTINQVSAPLRIGVHERDVEGLIDHFDGKIDDVRIWSDVRTPTEIKNNFKSTLNGDEAGLVGYWKFDNDALDATSNDNDLSGSGTPTFDTDEQDFSVHKVYFGSVETQSGTNDANTVFTAPSGLKEGDLMIASTGAQHESKIPDAPSKSDFTGILSRNNSSPDMEVLVSAKIADSSDEAASDFTFENDDNTQGGEMTTVGALFFLYTTGEFTDTNNIIDTDNDSGSGSSPTYSGGVNVVGDDAMLVMGALSGNGSGGAVTASGYEVANDDPTWTEQVDFDESSGGDTDTALAFATAVRGPGETSSYSIDFSGSTASLAFLLTVQTTQDVTVSAGTLSASSALESSGQGAGATVRQGFIDENIIARWTLDENAADTNVLDLTGNQPNGTASQNTEDMSVAGQINTAFTFNGTSDNVTIPHDASQLPSNGLTIACWVKPGTQNESTARIVGKGTANNNGYLLSIGNSTAFTITIHNLGISAGAWDVTEGEWQHVAFTLGGGNRTLYKNGEEISSGATSASLDDVTTTDNLAIGSQFDDDNWYTGEIDDVRIYDAVLTADQIATIANKEKLSASATLQSSTVTAEDKGSVWTHTTKDTGSWTFKSK